MAKTASLTMLMNAEEPGSTKAVSQELSSTTRPLQISTNLILNVT